MDRMFTPQGPVRFLADPYRPTISPTCALSKLESPLHPDPRENWCVDRVGMGKCLLHEWPLWAVDSTLRHAVESLAAGYIGLDFAEDVGDLNRVTRDQLTQGKPYLQFAHDVEVASAIEALLNKDSERCKECGHQDSRRQKSSGPS